MKQSFWNALPAPVNWSEGMVLSPQHFQQDQIFWETQIQALRSTISPHCWGLIQLEFDPGRLVQGDVLINKISAIMPDGLLINFNSENDSQLNLKISDLESKEPTQLSLSLSDNEALKKKKRVTVYLAVPRRVPGCASDKETIHQRYDVVDGEAEVDDNTGEGGIFVNRLQPKFSLQAVEHLDKKYVGLALFEIIEPDEGNYQIGDYCPPIVSIGAQTFTLQSDKTDDKQPSMQRKTIQQRCQALALSIRKKARQLAGYSETGDERLGHKISEIHAKWIRVLTKNLAEFELIADNWRSRPSELYSLLARMVGSFSELDSNKIPPKLPIYKHKEILTGFDVALEYLNTQLRIVNLRYTSIHLEEERSGMFTLHYDKAWLGQNLLVELSGKESDSSEDLASWFKACRVASIKVHEQLAKKRLLGAEVKQLKNDSDYSSQSLRDGAEVEQVKNDLDTGLSVREGEHRALFLIYADAKHFVAGQKLLVLCTNGKLKSFQPKRITLHLPHEQRVTLDHQNEHGG
jgi:type VI secretion system protein ImpJ